MAISVGSDPSARSRWYRTDFQIASPLGGFKLHGADLRSPEGRAAAAESYVNLIKEAGIEVFAVTDHNSTTMLEEIRVAARAAGVVMFPGMELSTGTGSDGVHLLLLGDPDANIAELTAAWNAAAGFSKDHPAFNDQGQHQPSRRSMIDILEQLPEDTIAIAPHILTENGVASGNSITESSIKWRCLHHDRLEAVDVGTPNDKKGFNSKFRARELDHFPAVKRMAYVATSDAYEPDRLGRHTWVRMHRPDAASLRQALLDHEARVLCDWDTRLPGDPNVVTHAYIKSIRMEQLSTSSDALDVEFDPRITVIIGSRGSGKSTLVQGLRALYGGDTNLPESVRQESARYQDEVFREATITSSFVEALSGAEDTATWQHSSGAQTQDGNSLINVRVVSQKELFERTSGDRPDTQSPSANMLALIDEALEDDQVSTELVANRVDVSSVRVDQFAEELRERQRRFQEATALRLETVSRLAGRKKTEEELAQVERKLAALDDDAEKQKLASAQVVLDDKAGVARYASKSEELAEALEAIVTPTRAELSTGTGIRFITPLQELVERASSTVAELAREIRRTVTETRTALGSETDQFASAVSSAEAVKAAYEAKLAELGVDLTQYEALKSQKASCIEELASLNELANELQKQIEGENLAWDALDDLHTKRRDARDAFTRIVSTRTPNLRFSINAYADHAGWQRAVHTELGFRQGDHLESLRSIAEWIWGAELRPEERLARADTWRNALLNNDFTTLSEARLSSSFVGRLKQTSDSARITIAAMRADDALDMRFLKQGNDPQDERSWQTVTDGSPGQRSAAMLAFTLSYGDSPLVLDQPEDDLDSALVSELIVTQFRKARWKRQLIVVTHEANIPVNTDAETVVVLENAEGRLRVVSRDGKATSGPIDNIEVRKSIQDLLEGGVRAFVNRERRYDNELSKYRIDVGLLARQRTGES